MTQWNPDWIDADKYAWDEPPYSLWSEAPSSEPLDAANKDRTMPTKDSSPRKIVPIGSYTGTIVELIPRFTSMHNAYLSIKIHISHELRDVFFAIHAMNASKVADAFGIDLHDAGGKLIKEVFANLEDAAVSFEIEHNSIKGDPPAIYADVRNLRPRGLPYA